MKNLLKNFARQFAVGVGMLALLTVILGAAYPLGMWAVSRIGAHSAEGGRLTDARGCDVGSALIGVDPKVSPGQRDWYLHGRVAGGADDPMAAGDPSSSGASNLGPNSTELRSIITARRAEIARREGVTPAQVPADAVTRSGSSLDPDISLAYAQLQIPRIARVGHLSMAQVQAAVDAGTSGRQWGFLGEPRVNVNTVNLALGHQASGCTG